MTDWHLPAALLLKLLIDLSLKGGVLLLLAVLTVRSLRRGSAEQRYTALTLVFHGLLFLPLLLPAHPFWRFPLLPVDLVDRLVPAFVRAPAGAETGSQLMVLFWLFGLLAVLTRLLCGLAGVAHLRRRATPVLDPQWRSLLSELRSEIGVSKHVQLLEHPGIATALAIGIFRPAILVPSGARRWSTSRRRAILSHELIHHRRRDNLTNLVVQAVIAVHWFNPLVWWAGRQLRADRERACDDAVLRMGIAPSDYVESLISFIPRPRRIPASVEVGQASALKTRLRAILDPAQRRTPVGWLRTASQLVAIFALVASLSLLDLWLPRSLSAELDSPLALLARMVGSRAQGHALRTSDEQSSRADRALESRAFSNHGARHAARTRMAAATAEASSPDQALAAAHETTETTRLTAGIYAGDRAFGYSAPQAFLRGTTQSSLPPATRPETAGSRLSAPVALTDLGTLGGDSSTATSLNDLGQVAGHSLTETGDQHPFVWSPGEGMYLIGLPQSLERSEAVDINNAGQVLVRGEHFDGGVSSYLWSRARGAVPLGSLGGSRTEALAVNDAGQVVGLSEAATGTTQAFFWSESAGIVELGGQEAIAVNNNGLVVARAGSFSFVWHAELGFARIGDVGVQTIPFDVNDRGEVVGMATFDSDGPPRAFVWSLENGMIDLGDLLPEAALSVAYQINEQGQVVGVSRYGAPIANTAMVAEREQAFIWSADTGLRNIDAEVTPGMMLNNLGQLVGRLTIPVSTSTSAALFWSEESGSIELSGGEREPGFRADAVALNNRGQVIGNARTTRGQQTRALLWQLNLPSPH